MSVKKTSQILKLKLKKSKLAIIDIGSNSVRLVVFADLGKYPYPLFNERVNCRLDDNKIHQKKITGFRRRIFSLLKMVLNSSILLRMVDI